jgi:hypothetical protein
MTDRSSQNFPLSFNLGLLFSSGPVMLTLSVIGSAALHLSTRLILTARPSS